MTELAIKNATKPGWQSTEAILTGALGFVAREVTMRPMESAADAAVRSVALICLTCAVIFYSNHRSTVKRASLGAAPAPSPTPAPTTPE